jgi:hypothetical protein
VSVLLERLPGNQQSLARAIQNLPQLADRPSRMGQLSQAEQGINVVL